MATQNAISTSIPIVVGEGGTGATSLTEYSVTCGGTTTTGPIQSVASVGTADQVLTSNGAGALPTFQDISADPGTLDLIETKNLGVESAWTEFTTGIDGTYNKYCFIMSNCRSNNSAGQYLMQVSTDGGSSYIGGTAYQSTNIWNAYNSTTIASNAIAGSNLWIVNDNQSGPNYTFNAVIWFYNMGTNTGAFMLGESTQRDTSGTLRYGSIMANRNVSETINAFRITGSGYFASGTLSLYGVND